MTASFSIRSSQDGIIYAGLLFLRGALLHVRAPLALRVWWVLDARSSAVVAPRVAGFTSGEPVAVPRSARHRSRFLDRYAGRRLHAADRIAIRGATGAAQAGLSVP